MGMECSCKHILLSGLLVTNLLAEAQDKYFVEFTDKKGTPYSVDRPKEFLSQRAIDRRLRQNLFITDADLPVSPGYTQQVVAVGVNLLYTSRWFNGAVVSATTNSAIEAVRSLSFVKSVTKVFDAGKKGSELGLEVEEQDYHPSRVKSDTFNYGISGTQVRMLKGNTLHNNGHQGQGVVIAVLDAGFYRVDTYPAFDSLRKHNRILGTKDFVDPASDIYNEHLHGMIVLSAMAGYVDGQLVGTAPKASYWLIRTEDGRSEQLIEEYNWVAGAEFADSLGADIINTSLGYTTFDVESQNHTQNQLDGKSCPISIAAGMAADKGMLVVVSAGNEGDNAWHSISVPADAYNILAVGSVSSSGVHSYFSSYGPSADGRIKPEVMAMGEGTVCVSGSGSIGTANGTSLSAPVISGLAACLWQSRPELTATELRSLIINSSSLCDNPNNALGYGIPDFDLALNRIDQLPDTVRGITVSPNPFDNHLVITFPAPIAEKVKVSLLGINGQTVFTAPKRIEGITVSVDFPRRVVDGTYVLMLVGKHSVWRAKVVKRSGC